MIAETNWPAGNSEGKKSMERSDDLKSWNSYSASEADSVSGLFGTPKKSNSNSNEKENKNGENNEEENNDTSLSSKKISNLSISVGEFKNQIVLGWKKLTGVVQYEIYYSLEETIDENNLIKINDYVAPKISEEGENVKAIIPDLYFGKKYYFAVRAKGDNDTFSLLSEKVEKTTEASSPILSFKYGDYSYSHKYSFSGPALFSNASQLSKFSEEDINYSGYSVVDANNNLYLQGQIQGKQGIHCFDSSGELKWSFEGQGGDPFIGKDGTIYFNNSEYLFAVSPSGVLKWKEKFMRILSRDPILNSNGDIIFLSLNESSKPDLVLVKDLGKGASRETMALASQLLGDVSLVGNSELAMNKNGEIYFGLSNRLIKYSGGNVETKTVLASCSNSYVDTCSNYITDIISVIAADNGNVYALFNNAFIGEYDNFKGIYALSSSNFSGDYLGQLYNVVLSAVGEEGVYAYTAFSNIFSQQSRIMLFDSSAKIEKWRKEWSDSEKRPVVFIDSDGVAYIRNGQSIVGYNSKSISDKNSNPNDDIVFQVNTGEASSNISVLEDKVFFVGKNISQILK